MAHVRQADAGFSEIAPIPIGGDRGAPFPHRAEAEPLPAPREP
ncbi:hypothetical protein [Streptomyces sp. NPDC059008]